jgi:hypothetical protein
MADHESFELPNARSLAPVALKLKPRRTLARGVLKSPSKQRITAAVLLEA